MDWIELFGGIAIFIYGMQLARDGLQRRLGDQLRRWLAVLTKRRLTGLLSGALLAATLQSSTATVVMLVGFANAGMLTLSQAMSVLLGAGIGTTLTVQLISFRVSHIALVIVVLGFVMWFIGKRSHTRALGVAILGFGFVFLGIKLTVEAASPLQQNVLLLEVIQAFADHPILGALAGAGLTAIVQSSAITLGLLLSLAFSNLLTLEAALPLVLGANVGNCVLPFLSAIGTSVDGRRVAWADLLFKIGGVAVGVLLLSPFSAVVAMTATTPPHQIATAHLLFNLIIAMVFLPLLPVGAALCRWLVPEEPPSKDEGSTSNTSTNGL